MGLILVQGTKILHVAWFHQPTNKQNNCLFPLSLENHTSVLEIIPSHGGRKTQQDSASMSAHHILQKYWKEEEYLRTVQRKGKGEGSWYVGLPFLSHTPLVKVYSTGASLPVLSSHITWSSAATREARPHFTVWHSIYICKREHTNMCPIPDRNSQNWCQKAKEPKRVLQPIKKSDQSSKIFPQRIHKGQRVLLVSLHKFPSQHVIPNIHKLLQKIKWNTLQFILWN